ncbi:DUF3310 domain-containing protein [Staphylococcus xylosus]|uniref:DUF3310 domain-containing protein n=1 Tax=Staphylococcus xylosus TaxID=1288 RepID=UPI0033651939
MKKQIDDLKVGNFVVLTLRNGQETTGRITYIDYNLQMADMTAFEGNTYIIDNSDTFELWQDRIEDKTERIRKARRPSNASKWLEKAVEDSEEYINKVKSNDVQQRKRNEQNTKPDYYQFDDFEMYEIVEAICKHYNPVVAAWIGQAIQYIGRAPRKNGKEDIGKARDMIEQAFKSWDK